MPHVLWSLGGVASRTAILASATEYALRRASAEGAVVRTSHGLYALPDQLDRAVVRGLRGALSHRSAAFVWDLGLLGPVTRRDVTVDRHRGRIRVPPSVTLHYAPISAAEIQQGLTTALRTVVDCARTCAFPEALSIADTAVRTSLVTLPELRQAVLKLRGTGAPRARRIGVQCDPRSMSPLESALRGLLVDAGVTCFAVQFPATSDGRRIATADLGDARSRVVLEADSFLWHGQRAALERDARRYDELAVNGFLVLRFAWEHVMGDPAWVIATVQRAVRDRGGDPSAAADSPFQQERSVYRQT